MIYLFNSRPPSSALCFYKNTTRKMQIVRIINIPNWRLEKIVFPAESFMFYAIPTSILEISSCDRFAEISLHTISCEEIRVVEREEIRVVERLKVLEALAI